ncbi:MAG: DNA recombination protein RmuC [Puniceicoccales bacterium]|jgi:DNA recombination protein RmuC|nr:DNA recombination protein RmuC [Puniceicoccales bacterium]
MFALVIIFGIASVAAAVVAAKRRIGMERVGKKLTEVEMQLAISESRLADANGRIAERDNLERKWREQFEQLSAKALRDNNEAFLLLAKNSFCALTNEASSGFGNAIKPIESTLKLFDEKLKKLEEQRQTAYIGLAEQLKLSNRAHAELKEETNNLCNALRRPDVRGQWGEMQLRRTVELAGMAEHVDFEEQKNVTSQDGQNFRPDMVINLPNARTIVVDAKAPLNLYADVAASTKRSDGEFFEKFAAQIKRHVEKLSSKNYWQQFENSPEFVVLFLPGENFLSDAFRADASLLEFGVSRRVMLVTPTTLIALLQAISYGWKQAHLTDKAREIIEIGKEMYGRLKIFFDHFNGVGKSISSSVDAFNRMRASAEARLIPQAKKFQMLGLNSAEIDLIGHLDGGGTVPSE